ncbi:MAG: DciA family protein [Thermoleophilia bacterium]
MARYRNIGSIVRRERDRLWRTSPGLCLQSLWEQAVGVEIAASTRVETFREGVMIVSCESGGWACELKLSAAELTGRLNALDPPEEIKEIRFVHQARGKGKSRK